MKVIYTIHSQDVVGQVEQQNLMGAESGPEDFRDRQTQHLHLTQQNSTQVRFLSKIKEQVHHHYITTRETSGKQLTYTKLSWKLQETCPHNKIWAREVRKRVHKGINVKHNHNQAPTMVTPTQPQYFHLGTQVQVDHTYNAQLVVEMITSERIIDKIISAPGVDQDHMLHICAEHW